MRAGPPGVARALVAWLAGRGERVWVLNDLAEEYEGLVVVRGRRAADAWYWRQVADSAGPLLTRRLTSGWPRLLRRASQLCSDLGHDVRHGARVAVKSPLASGAIVLTLALATGATTAIWSVLEALVVAPLPLSAPERLARVLERGEPAELSYGTLAAWGTRSTRLSGAAGYATSAVTLDDGVEPERVRAAVVTEGFASVLGVVPVRGRVFTAAEHGWRGPRAVLISHGLWQRRFGGREVVGETVRIDDRRVRIVGVLPRLGFEFPPGGGDVWLPLAAEPGSWQLSRRTEWLSAIVRLRAGTTAVQAAAELSGLDDRAGRRVPRYRLQALPEAITGPVRPMLGVVGAALAGVLLLACVNLAMLLSARGEERRAEFAVRSALGGRGGRIVRQVLTESALLAVVGGVLGLWIGREAVRVMVALYPGDLPRADAIGLSTGELGVASATLLLLVLAFGVPAALRAAQAPGRELRIGRVRTPCRPLRRARAAMVIVQVGLSAALLMGGGLLVATFWRLNRVHPGFDRNGVLTFHVAPPESRYDSRREVSQFHRELEATLRSVAGVRAVGSVNNLPLRGVVQTERVRPAHERRIARDSSGAGAANAARRFRADVRAVRGDYFAALGVPLIRGAWFDGGTPARRVTVLNATLAARLFGDGDPIGRRVEIDDRVRTVIGVVGDTRSRSLGQRPRGEAYLPAEQGGDRSAAIVLRTAGQPHAIIPAVRAAVRRIDPGLALADIATMAQRIDTSIAPQRFHAALLGSLSLLALLLAATGIYGMVAYSVSQRNREIGIRLALGEDARTVRRRVLLPVLGLAATGCMAGALLTIVTSEWFDDVMEEVAADAGVLAGVPLLLLAVALAAAWGPACRAGRVDPMTAIRE